MLVLKETGRTAKFILSILVDPIERFISAFAKLRKGTISFVMSVLPVCPPAWNSAPSGWIFMKFGSLLAYSSKISRENSSVMKSDKNDGQ